MYAVVQTCGKQYRVKAGDSIRVDTLDKKLGEEFTLDQVLLVGGDTTTIGNPTVKGAKVGVMVVREDRGPKIITIKRKRRKGYRRTIGHRQWYMELFVTSITGADGKSVTADSKPEVYDLAKAQEVYEGKMAKLREENKKARFEGAGDKKAEAAPAAKKVAKKATAKKSTAKKKSGAKKKSAKKKSAGKKAKAKKD